MGEPVRTCSGPSSSMICGAGGHDVAERRAPGSARELLHRLGGKSCGYDGRGSAREPAFSQ